jgi:spermidine synthase
MSFVLSVVLAYQAIYGYVYEMIGILSATFMIGLWIGTFITRTVKKPLKILFCLELATILLALSSLIFFSTELFFYVLVFVAGIVIGSQFSTANLSMEEPNAGGKLYALDLIGSFTGALIPSLIIIPLFGVPNTLLLIALIKAFSAVMILSIFPSFQKQLHQIGN